MEEIINRLAKAVATYPFEARNYPNCIVFREDLENLINKYKEQEKIIELMAEKLAIYKFEEIICMETECEHIELQNEGKCIGDKECILEYFKKKARTSNEI